MSDVGTLRQIRISRTTAYQIAARGRVPDRWIDRARTCLVAVLLILMAGNVLAHSKTDIIVLQNGSTIKGEIKGLQEGKLSFGTDSMGTVNVEWEDVVEVTSEFGYEVRLQNGERLYGSLEAAPDPRDVRVVEADGQSAIAILDVVELRVIEEQRADRFDVEIGLGYSFDNASDVSTFSLTSEVNYQDERGVTSLNGRTSRTDQDGASISSNRYSIGRQFWTRRPNVVRWFDGSYEDNDELELDYRFTAGFGFGRAVFETNDRSLIGILGLQGAQEKGNVGDSLTSLEGVLGVMFSTWHFDDPELDLSTDLMLYPGITESGRWRGNAQVQLSWELVNDFYWVFTTWATYDNQSQSGSDTDYGVTAGLSWEY